MGLWAVMRPVELAELHDGIISSELLLRVLLLKTAGGDGLYCGRNVRLVLKPAEAVVREKYCRILADKLADKFKRTDPNNAWKQNQTAAWSRYKPMILAKNNNFFTADLMCWSSPAMTTS